MNPKQPKSEQTGLNLPLPSPDRYRQNVEPAKPELDYQIPRPSGSQLQDNPLAQADSALPANPSPVPVKSQPLPAAPNDSALTSLPHSAGDLDLIEKEWVAKAKHLIAKNRNNPYEQAREISLLKAAYLKKRFNKEPKAADG